MPNMLILYSSFPPFFLMVGIQIINIYIQKYSRFLLPKLLTVSFYFFHLVATCTIHGHMDCICRILTHNTHTQHWTPCEELRWKSLFGSPAHHHSVRRSDTNCQSDSAAPLPPVVTYALETTTVDRIHYIPSLFKFN